MGMVRDKIKVWRPKTVKQRIATASVVAALAAAAAVSFIFIQKKDTLALRGNYQVSLMGERKDYSGKIRLVYDKKTGNVTLQNEERSLFLGGVPVYSAGDREAVLSSSMIYTNYDTEMIGRVNHFARVSWADSISRIHIGGKKDREYNGGYLYDGRDIYLFLEPMTLRWGEETLSLSPLSYASVVNKQGFYYYDPASGQSGYISSGEQGVRATDEKGIYDLNLSQDMADLKDGKSLLLPPEPEAFGLLE